MDSELLQQILGVGSAVGGGLLTKEAYDKLGEIGQTAQTESMNIANQVNDMGAFSPIGITSGLGNMQIDASGGINAQLSPEQQALSNQLTGGAGQMFNAALDGSANRYATQNQDQLQGMLPGMYQYADPQAYTRMSDQKIQNYNMSNMFNQRAGQDIGGAQQAIYDQIRATQMPGEQRAALALEERLNAQGRGGVATAQYGGTPEQLAMQKAMAEAQNQAAYQARGQALGEQAQNAALGQQYGQMGYQGTIGQSQLGTQGLQNVLNTMGTVDSLNTSGLQQQALAAGIGGQMMGAAYEPYSQMNQMGQLGANFANIANTNVRQQAGLFGDAAMGGLEALLGSGLGQANLVGNLGSGLLSGALTPISDGAGGLFSSILGRIN